MSAEKLESKFNMKSDAITLVLHCRLLFRRHFSAFGAGVSCHVIISTKQTHRPCCCCAGLLFLSTVLTTSFFGLWRLVRPLRRLSGKRWFLVIFIHVDICVTCFVRWCYYRLFIFPHHTTPAGARKHKLLLGQLFSFLLQLQLGLCFIRTGTGPMRTSV